MLHTQKSFKFVPYDNILSIRNLVSSNQVVVLGLNILSELLPNKHLISNFILIFILGIRYPISRGQMPTLDIWVPKKTQIMYQVSFRGCFRITILHP